MNYKFYGRICHTTVNLSLLITSKRNLRYVVRTPRQRLPRYKVNVGRLPPLTKFLTHHEEDFDLRLLRQEKLNVYKQYLPVNQKPVLLEALLNTDQDIDQLLRVIDENLETMTSFYVGVSFESLDDTMRANPSYKSTVAVAPEFRRLCSKALYKMRFLEADEVLKVIKCLSTLNIPESALIVQATLQMVRHLINDFNDYELRTLSSSLNCMRLQSVSNKSLLKILQTAIPVAQQRLVSSNLVHSNTGEYAPSKPETSEESNGSVEREK